MVSDKPPRRSRSGKTPVTLDLAAEDKGIIAEPVRANDTDEPTASTPVDPWPTMRPPTPSRKPRRQQTMRPHKALRHQAKQPLPTHHRPNSGQKPIRPLPPARQRH